MPTGIYKHKCCSKETKKKLSEALKKNPPLTQFKKGNSAPKTAFQKGHKPWNKDKKMSIKFRKKLSLAHIGKQSGKDNPAWKGGISFEPYTYEFNNNLKEYIRLRDSYTCQLCGANQIEFTKRLPIHHIDYNKKNNSEFNLITLCINCNSKVNINRSYWQLFFQNKIRVNYIRV